jgi:hypothetical protein
VAFVVVALGATGHANDINTFRAAHGRPRC